MRFVKNSNNHTYPSNKLFAITILLAGAMLCLSISTGTYLILVYQSQTTVALSVLIFLSGFAVITVLILKFVNRPIERLLEQSRRIEALKTELNKQKNEYQMLFEQVPCLITVQDRDYRLIGYNREFSEKFKPDPEDYCFHAYKGRSDKCHACPVEQTFKDGDNHTSEEIGTDKNGNVTHWIVKTSPVKDESGNIVAAMEMSIDITQMRHLEKQLEKTEKNYQEIFNTIPNPLFVLDAESLEILDCNKSVKSIYGYEKDEILQRSFLTFFQESERASVITKIKSSSVINQLRHITRAGKSIFVDIWISPSEYAGKKVLLVTASDITKRLETEQQLIQASKMATLGEMATGVAHELNQPLSVIKTSSSFFMKKINKKEHIRDNVRFALLEKIDHNVDRATKIINHMRQFARKSNMELEYVQVNDVLEGAFEIFSQQLKVRGISVLRDLEPDLPRIKADPGRLEQVFINLLINARDAIEAKLAADPSKSDDSRITLHTKRENKHILVEICDTGVGIPKAVLDKIFEPFFTTKEVGKGTGLGLSISYGIIKECGGNIHVTSTEGEGACFTMKFPVPENENGSNDFTG